MMSSKEFIIRWMVGDKVEHVEGGPPMEVTKIVGRSVWCTWKGNAGIRTRVIPADELYRARSNVLGLPDGRTLRAGLLVQHLSGGPHMSITEIAGDWAWCEWVVHSHPQSRRFLCSELIEVSREQR